MQERPDSKTLAPLTSVRLFAASGILFFHIWPWFFGSPAAPGWPLGQSISLFFVLSGFILYYVYPTLEAPGSARRFLVARIARLWPVHMLALGLVFALQLPASHGSLADLAANALLLHAWIPVYHTNFAFNGVSWTLSTEMGFYALFPFLVHRFRQTWWWKLAGAALLTFAILTACALLGIGQNTEGGVSSISLGYTHPLTRLFEFVLGMTAALVWQRIGRHPRISVTPATAMEATSIILVVASMYWSQDMANYLNNYAAPIYGQWAYRAGTSSVAFAVLLVVLAMRRGLISAALSWTPLVVLGQVSFAIYMIHQILQIWMDRDYPPSAWGLPPALSMTIFVLVTVALSYAIFRWFETPLRYWLVRLYDRATARRRDEIPGDR